MIVLLSGPQLLVHGRLLGLCWTSNADVHGRLLVLEWQSLRASQLRGCLFLAGCLVVFTGV